MKSYFISKILKHPQIFYTPIFTLYDGEHIT